MSTTTMPARAYQASPEPLKREGPGHHPEANAEDQTTQSRQYADAGPATQSAHAVQHKAWATAQARCTLAGFTANLIDGDNGRSQMIVSRWALCKAFSSPAEVDAWLLQVAGSAQ